MQSYRVQSVKPPKAVGIHGGAHASLGGQPEREERPVSEDRDGALLGRTPAHWRGLTTAPGRDPAAALGLAPGASLGAGQEGSAAGVGRTAALSAGKARLPSEMRRRTRRLPRSSRFGD